MLRARINAGTYAVPSGSDVWFIGSSSIAPATDSPSQDGTISFAQNESMDTGAGWEFAQFTEAANLRFTHTMTTTRRFSTAKAAFNWMMSVCSASPPHPRKGCVIFKHGDNTTYSEYYVDEALVKIASISQNNKELTITYVVQGGKLVIGTQAP